MNASHTTAPVSLGHLLDLWARDRVALVVEWLVALGRTLAGDRFYLRPRALPGLATWRAMPELPFAWATGAAWAATPQAPPASARPWFPPGIPAAAHFAALRLADAASAPHTPG